ncbi:MAG: cytochrome C biogenesis protein [SAR324 cluster bacterium]|uniref:Cytochrome C biogenesis protein n=1 Tax=SAR324 cluster bacterium TaxID=2024889 RepID=A0A2A4T5H3_9DELT|nr:MAG: cytochrome C biogenesis protein [SAR324 cluster bacterium]
MIVDIGYYALLAAITMTLYGILAGTAGILKNNGNLIQSSRYAVLSTFSLVAVSYFVLTYAFITDDFSVDFVAGHSSTDLPLFYKITGVWGGMEGSLLLWEFILSLYIAIIAFRYHKSNKAILPYALIVLNLISFFILFMLIGWSNPLARLIPTPLEGQGLNPLLQNLGMVIHPPLLYLGFVGVAVPYAFAMGSLLRGKIDNEWALVTRRWTLVAWLFLTAGMGMGGQWAYVELGWGGYWAWDPVENSSLMPWLTATAFLHSVIVQEKRDSLKIWNMLLVTATFVLTILGTFITRSGVLNSVHAFAKSPIGPAFLIFIALILTFSLGLLFIRQDMLASKKQEAGLISRENSFLLNNVLFVGMAFTVLYGTLFPLLAEGLADKKLSIQAPFFNSIMAPLAILTIFLMGTTQFLGWKRTSRKMLAKNMLIPSTTGILFMIAGAMTLDVPWQFIFLAGMGYFAGYQVLMELIRAVRGGKKSKGQATQNEEQKQKRIKSLLRNRRKQGSAIIHLGVLVFLVGILGNYFGHESSFTFYPGDEKTVGDYTVQFEKLEESKARNADLVTVKLNIFKEGQHITTLNPAKAFYPTSTQPMTEVSIYRTLKEDLYTSVATINNDGSATINVYINPMVNFIWVSSFFFIVGTLLCLSYKSPQLKSGAKALKQEA